MESANTPNKYSKLSELLEKVTTRYDAYSNSIVSQIEVIESSLNKCLEDSERKSEGALLENLSSELLQKRPLSKMEEHSKGFYKYISKLGRDINKLQKVKSRDLHLYDIEFDHKSLKESIGEYLLTQVLRSEDPAEQSDSLKGIVEELGLLSSRELNKCFAVMCEIKSGVDALERKDLYPLKKWTIKKIKNLKKEKSSLASNLLFLLAYKCIFEEEKTVQETIDVLSHEKKLISNSKKKSVQKLFGSLVFMDKSGKSAKGQMWHSPCVQNEQVLDLLNQRYG